MSINRSESKFHSKMMRWLKHNKALFPKSFLIETKVVRPNSKSFPFRELSDKEERLLLKAKNSFILQTHSDIAMLGTNCDGACISGGGYIFLHWVRRNNKAFYVIDIKDFIKHRNKSKRKSLTEIDAKSICYLTGYLV